MRVGIVDIGTNSTRLLVAEVDGGKVHELARRSIVTRLGRGVDTSGQLSAEAIDDVCEAVGGYIAIYEEIGVDRVTAIATSAVRDAENSAVFLAELRERFALDARILDGTAEARLTYYGACTGRAACEKTLVCDIGGGSTELVIGDGPEVGFHASLQAGTVRHTERHISHDPPEAAELEALAGDVRELIGEALPGAPLAQANEGVAVAGTPTSLAAIEMGLEPYDPDRVHGYVLPLTSIQRMLSELASVSLAERLRVKGLPEGRAPTIVAGVVILVQVMRAFGLDEIEVSEHDILWGAALEAAGAQPAFA
jgi:exopolyphosphatase/guanosine-5'-triphosphate,3'-diphosphate pyrophosphatase